MQTISALWSWIASWGLIGLCALAVVGLCYKCGFPVKHRTPPSLDSIVITVLGVVGLYSAINLFNSARGMNPTDSQRVPIIVAAFVLFFVGINGLTRGFNKAISEAPPPPPKHVQEEQVAEEQKDD